MESCQQEVCQAAVNCQLQDEETKTEEGKIKYADIHTNIHTCIHTYIHTYIHAYIHTYRQTDRQTEIDR